MADVSQFDGDDAQRTRPFMSRRRAALVGGILVLAVVVVLGACTIYLAVRADEARNSLNHAQTLVRELQKSVTTDPAGSAVLAEGIRAETGHARELTSDWVWRAAEGVPVLGKNLSVGRQLIAAVDEVAVDALVPLAGVASNIDISTLRPVDGRVSLQPIIDAREVVASSDDALASAKVKVAALDTSGTLQEIVDSRAQVERLIAKAAGTTASARIATQIIPSLLGSDGPRNYLLMFQNNAEARSLGGNVASLLLIHVDNGAVSIAQQASSGDFPRNAEPPIAIDPNIYSVYYPSFPRYIQDVATRPDFPFTAQLGKGWWESVFGGTIDGVISFDPIALASLLDATGPIQLSTGETLTSDNAVKLILSDAYENYPDPDDSDRFFAEAAGSVFSALTSGGTDPKKLLSALEEAATQGRFLAWSTNEMEQAQIATLPLAGVLPSDNTTATTAGVYFNDQSASKIDYWVSSVVDLTADYCTAPDAPVFTITYTLSSLLTQAKADRLPSYVAAGSLPRGQFLTDVYILGPPGATFLDSTVDVPGIANTVLSNGGDLGRPIVRMNALLGAEGTTTVTVRFTGVAGDYGPLALTTTPMVHPTDVVVAEPAICAG
ncbi:DUF4012 domain-containing protein [Naasia lichenicola]|uniref:DUF4012 domain-containing protein n=1 Tax=Naasia lichenicola TaxID=2565933 RepID=A0A4S4FMY2_9MICO|nr:DUF4012 domain-containing protein [Naasia lichenicola]THG30815.1 DUF4012 domain-containing protein [Naasia lichenicola]